MGRIVLKMLLLCAAVAGAFTVSAQELAEPLKPLAAFVGKTWKGELREPGSDKVNIDVCRWERALNGKAIRVLHSVNNGEYGGESIILWDQSVGRLIYFYFTTADFYTQGTVEVEEGKLTSHEFVKGEAGGVTEVRAVAEMLPDGSWRSTSEYRKDGKWTKGHQVIYQEAPGEQVVFK